MTSLPTSARSARFWPDRRTVWRWHFYAGLFCIPFVLLLSVTGSIYLFKPQIDALIDRPYDHLAPAGPRADPATIVAAALAAEPGSRLAGYELPRSEREAVRVIVDRHGTALRLYVDPWRLHVLKRVAEADRFERIIFRLHGELLIGPIGSMVVELAASWAIVMILTGLVLWWPRGPSSRLMVFPSFRVSGRAFWRELHAAAGLWVSATALFLLVSGMPWSFVWGNALAELRAVTAAHAPPPDWPIPGARMAGMAGMDHGGNALAAPPDHHGVTPAQFDPRTLDRLVARAATLSLAYPATVIPPARALQPWTARSDAQDRPERVTVTLSPSGQVLKRVAFADRPLIDRIVAVGVAAHEGQLFGLLNQLLGLSTAIGLFTLSISAVVLWWHRKPLGRLGAPDAAADTRFGAAVLGAATLLGVALPMLGLSMVVVAVIERLVLRRLSPVARWLGLEASLPVL